MLASHCPVVPMLPAERMAHLDTGRETAALRNFDGLCRRWVTSGKARGEYYWSALPPKAGIDRCVRRTRRHGSCDAHYQWVAVNLLMEFEEPRAAACEVELLAHAHQTPARRSLWVIRRHSAAFADVRYWLTFL